MCALLTELNVIKVLREPVPAEPDRKWQRAERIAKGTIIEYLFDSFISFASSDSTVKDIFDKLDSLYERKSVPTKIALKDKLSSFKMKSDASLESHFNEFDLNVREAIAAGVKLDESDEISYLFRSLSVDYNTPVFAMQTVLPDDATLAYVKNRLFDIELKIKEQQRIETSAKALSAEVKESASHVNNMRNNYPRKFNSHPRNNNFKRYKKTNKFKVKCFHCGKIGHTRNVCRELKYEENKKQNKSGNEQHKFGNNFSKVPEKKEKKSF